MKQEGPQLQRSEEVVLRRVALAALEGVPPVQLRHLQRLHLIEANGKCWRLTPLGQQRLKALPKPMKLSPDAASDEIERILAKFRKIQA